MGISASKSEKSGDSITNVYDHLTRLRCYKRALKKYTESADRTRVTIKLVNLCAQECRYSEGITYAEQSPESLAVICNTSDHHITLGLLYVCVGEYSKARLIFASRGKYEGLIDAIGSHDADKITEIMRENKPYNQLHETILMRIRYTAQTIIYEAPCQRWKE